MKMTTIPTMTTGNQTRMTTTQTMTNGNRALDENDPYGINAMFEEFDKNENGQLDKREYTEMWKEWCYGCEEDMINDMVEYDFENADENNDGSLSKEELEALYKPSDDWDY